MTATAFADIAAAYRRHLPPGEGAPFFVHALDRVGVPVCFAPYHAADLPVSHDGFGYGLTPDEAHVGALGELAECLYCERYLRDCDRERNSYAGMADLYGERHVADPLRFCLPAGSDYTPDRDMVWVPGERYPTGERVWLPLEFVAFYGLQTGGGSPLFPPITNGMGAGLSRAQALAHGLLELLQRDGNCTAFRALDRGVVVDLDAVTDPALQRALDHLRSLNINPVVKLASTEFDLVNVYCVGDDADPHALPVMLTACGEAAHPDRDRAVRKAVNEFAAARSRKAFMHGPLDAVARVAPPGYLDGFFKHHDVGEEEPRSLRTMADWMRRPAADLRAFLAGSVFAERGRVKLSELPTTPGVSDPEGRLQAVAGRLLAAGHDILFAPCTPPGHPVQAVKAVVSGIECETMSYYRVGERGVRRLLAEGSPLVGRGDPPAGARPVRLPAEATERLGGPTWFSPRAADAIVGDLYPLYREPERHSVQIVLTAKPPRTPRPDKREA